MDWGGGWRPQVSSVTGAQRPWGTCAIRAGRCRLTLLPVPHPLGSWGAWLGSLQPSPVHPPAVSNGHRLAACPPPPRSGAPRGPDGSLPTIHDPRLQLHPSTLHRPTAPPHTAAPSRSCWTCSDIASGSLRRSSAGLCHHRDWRSYQRPDNRPKGMEGKGAPQTQSLQMGLCRNRYRHKHRAERGQIRQCSSCR